MLDNFSINILSDLIDFDTNRQSRPTATLRRVVCLSLCISGGRSGEGKHPLLDNFSIKILFDLIDVDTNGQSTPRATL